MRPLPVIGGALALLVTFAGLWWGYLGLFTSMYGIMIAVVIAHGVGTAVALVLDLPARTLRRVGVAAVCSWIMWFVIWRLIHLAPRYFYSDAGMVVSAAIAYTLCAVVVRRVEPAWHRYAGPLALVAVVVLSTYVMIVTARSYPPPGVAPGGPNRLPDGVVPIR